MKIGKHQTVLVVDFGSQYSQLIARRVREANVYCELIPWDAPAEQFAERAPVGFILSGGPASVYEPKAPYIADHILQSGRPILGICYGMQALAHQLGGQVAYSDVREYGPAQVAFTKSHDLWAGLPATIDAWMSHGDRVERMPPGFSVIAENESSPAAAMAKDGLIGLQFHPEVVHTPLGQQLIANFLFKVCGCVGDWTPGALTEAAESLVRERVGEGRAICALSGGVDSAVAATIARRALGDRLTCVFVDNGLLRKGEAEQVREVFSSRFPGQFVFVDAGVEFLSALDGVVDPEQKRKVIGERFIRVFEREAGRLGDYQYIIHGTLYPDVIESATAENPSAQTIKTHHNVGGLPERMGLINVEPLRYLFKDEVRVLGEELGLPDEIVWRHPFPGPGLAIRILGEVTPDRLSILREADARFVDELRRAGLYRSVSQALAVLTDARSVGVMGDGRTYNNVVALRAVTTDDFMTADWNRLPYDLLARVSNRIVNEIPGVNRVVYDISTKPPATIEWE